MADIEIELRFPLKNPEQVIEFLNKIANPTAKNLFQRDTYLTPAHRDFLQNKFPFEWLRLRESNKKTSLDYKHFYPEGVEKTDYCDEFVTNIENPESLKKIFNHLNFKQSIVVEKNRNTWLFKDVEIAVDEIKRLGTFIELEIKKDFPTPQEAKAYLYEILKQLNAEVGEEDIRGYPFRILEKQGYKFGQQ